MVRLENDTIDILLTLAWLGEANREQIRRLHFPMDTSDTVRKLMGRLRQEGVVERVRWARRPQGASKKTPPHPQPTLYRLTRKGRWQINKSDQYPDTPFVPRGSTTRHHDVVTVDIICSIIEWCRAKRAGLTGLFVERESRRDLNRRRPIMDAVMVAHIGQPMAGSLTPWHKDPPLGASQVLQLAIENDRDTEEGAVVAGKAQAYRASRTEQWRERYGEFPLVLVVVPTRKRLNVWMNLWIREWPEGWYMMTTDEWLAEGDRWLAYHAETGIIERPLFPEQEPEPEQEMLDDPTAVAVIERREW